MLFRNRQKYVLDTEVHYQNMELSKPMQNAKVWFNTS